MAMTPIPIYEGASAGARWSVRHRGGRRMVLVPRRRGRRTVGLREERKMLKKNPKMLEHLNKMLTNIS
jgi:hypothetical protein